MKWGRGWELQRPSDAAASAPDAGGALQPSGPEAAVLWKLGVERDELGNCSVV